MKYEEIIKELKESSDPNVLAFVKDVEKIKRLSREKRQALLNDLKTPGAIDLLVKDSIPSIIKASYPYIKELGSLSILDLVNEGVVGAHRAFEKYEKERKAEHKKVTLHQHIAGAVRSAICKEKCPFAKCRFDEEDPELYKDQINPITVNSPMAKAKVIEVRKHPNANGIMIKECCASCAHKYLTDSSKRMCSKWNKKVKSGHCCAEWEMSDMFRDILAKV